MHHFEARCNLLILTGPTIGMLGMVSRSLLLTAVILFTVTAVQHAPAVWRGPPQMLVALDPEIGIG